MQGYSPAGVRGWSRRAKGADRGFEGGGKPPHQREWSGQGEALSWPQEYAGEDVSSKGIIVFSERVQGQMEA